VTTVGNELPPQALSAGLTTLRDEVGAAGLCDPLGTVLDLPTEPCPKCTGTGSRRLREAGAVLRRHRLERGVTGVTMARALGVTRQLVNDWEIGRHRVPQDLPERWAHVCRERGRCGGSE
jgi:hypothetical protein